MSDNTILPVGGGGDTVRTIDRGTAKTQVLAIDVGGEAGPESLVTSSNPLPVSGTFTVNQGSPPWSVKPDGVIWTQTGTSANVNLTNASVSVSWSGQSVSLNTQSSPPLLVQRDDVQFDDDGIQYVNPNVPGADIATGDRQNQQLTALQQIAAGVPVNQQGAWNVGVSNFPATQPVSGTVNVGNTVTVTGSLSTTPSTAPSPVYLDDQNVPLDDNGYQLVNTNWDGSDVATASAQGQQLTVLQQIAANGPVGTVSVSNFPSTQNVNVTNATPVAGLIVTTSQPLPTYLADSERLFDDDGIPYINSNVPGADIATGDKQQQQLQVLQTIAAGVPLAVQAGNIAGQLYPSINNAGTPGVAMAVDPTNAGTDGAPYNTMQIPQVGVIAGRGLDGLVHSIQTDSSGNQYTLDASGQLQRIADLLEALLLESRMHSALIASLGQAVPEDPDRLRNDLNLTLQ